MKNHKLFIPITAGVFAIFLHACGPIEFESYPDETRAAGATPIRNADRSVTEDISALPLQTRLILGTLRLEGTDQAVGAEQAAVLLPLWQQWHDLNRSDTATDQDRSALLEEIQAAMTPDQIQTIDAMQLTQADVNAYMEEAAQTIQAPGGDNGSNPFSDGTQTLSPEELATLQSVYQGGFGGSHGPEWVLLHTLLDLLESKTQA